MASQDAVEVVEGKGLEAMGQAGLVDDMDSPAVGVEPTRVEQSAIPIFQRYRLSTVDGIDTELGQLALIRLLGGGDPGYYGVRDTADAILPPIEPLPTG